MSGTKTTQNQWVSKQGEDYLQLLGPDGALLSGIDSTGAGFGALAGDGGGVTSVAATVTGGIISVSGSPVTSTGTLAFTVAGTSGGIPYFSSSSAWASSTALAAGQFVLGGGAGSAPTASFSIVPVASGGTGTASPALVAGTNITISGSFPNQTINSSGGGISGLTTGYLPKAASSSSIANSKLDDGVTTSNTLSYSGTGGITASAGPINAASDGTHAGVVQLIGNTTVPSLAADTASIIGPDSASFTAYGIQLPTAGPGSAGVAHLSAVSSAVSQLTVSAVSLSADVTGQLPIASVGSAGLSATSPIAITSAGAISLTENAVTAAGASLTPATCIASGTLDGTAPIVIVSSTTFNLGSTYSSGYYLIQYSTAGTGITGTLPATAIGKQYCVVNSGTTGVVNIGTITIYPPSGSYVILNGVVNTVGGGGTHGVVSGGAAGDGACFVAIDTTHWQVFPSSGTWANN